MYVNNHIIKLQANNNKKKQENMAHSRKEKKMADLPKKERYKTYYTKNLT